MKPGDVDRRRPTSGDWSWVLKKAADMETAITDIRCTWMDFYEELADRLLDFRDDRKELIDRLQKVFAAENLTLPKLDTYGVPADIDPFTVFGLFNKGLSDVNRKKVAAGLADEFHLAAPLPEAFVGIPTLNNLNATFYAFSDHPRREEGDIDRLWTVFETALAYADNPREATEAGFISAYDAVLHQFSISWKMTMGLYWIRPNVFANLDSRNRWFLGLPGNMPQNINNEIRSLKAVPEAAEYLALCSQILEAMNTGTYRYRTFPELSACAWLTWLKVNQQNKEREKASQDNSLGDADIETVHYWLYSPGEGGGRWDEFFERGTMGLGWGKLENLNDYPSQDDIRRALLVQYSDKTSQKKPALALWQFAHDVKPGDVVFAKRGRDEILGRGIVEGDYEYDEKGGYYPHLRHVKWTHKGDWHIDDMPAESTLAEVTDYTALVNEIGAFFDDAGGETETGEEPVDYPPYSPEDFLSEVYMDEATYDDLVGVLRTKKNIILQGAPGVGKTFAAKRLAYSMAGVKDPERVTMVQFHQSYSYEDFIEGFRPSAAGFELVKGSFYTFCKRAQNDSDEDYFFIIDEINRGNLSKIFGELFMLIENDKRGPKNKLQLLYSHELFYVPSNLYIIGMMNTADRSLAMLDYALRRRFAFFDLLPAFDSAGFVSYRDGLKSAKLNRLLECVVSLNEAIAQDETLGRGFCIGHSYFCGMNAEDVTDAKLSSVVEYELVPMLREYWFDDPSKSNEWADKLRRSIR